jgi:glycerate 2-kinase
MAHLTPQPLETDAAIYADHRALLAEMFEVALDSVSAQICLPAHLPSPSTGRRLVLGVGKAGAAMVRVAMRDAPPGTEAIVLTRYGHGLDPAMMPPGVKMFEAGHPLPDEKSVEAARYIMEAVSRLGAGDELLALISGGGSALLSLPVEGVSLAEKQNLTRELLLCGASISQINCVRKHLSQVKGGRLAVLAHPAKVITLAFSDIPGDDPALIASGPTIADRTKLADARRVLDVHKIDLPENVRAALADPANEAPVPGSPGLAGSIAKVVAHGGMALQAAGALAAAAGYKPVYLGHDLEGDATELGTVHAALALHHAHIGGRWALLSGGETTVHVHNPEGRGGRNTAYLLSLAFALNGAAGISAIACDTDGIDGTEDNAGARIDPATLARAQALGISASDALHSNQTYDFFKRLDDLVITGPTRTNVNDFRIILVDRPAKDDMLKGSFLR